ncbi:MAG: TonB family protein [Nitrospinae bacterium]|nr:TonB family protein [Nitrospinota bacterium]
MGNRRQNSLSLPLSISVAIHLLGLGLLGSVAFEYKREDSPRPIKIRNVIIESKPVEMEKPPAASPTVEALKPIAAAKSPANVPLDPMGLTGMANQRHRGQSESGQFAPARSPANADYHPPISARSLADLSNGTIEPTTLVRASFQSPLGAKEPKPLAMPSLPPIERVSAATPAPAAPDTRQTREATPNSRPSIVAVKMEGTSKAFYPSAVSTPKSSGTPARTSPDGSIKTKGPSETVLAFSPAAIQSSSGAREAPRMSGMSPLPLQPRDEPDRTAGLENKAAAVSASDHRSPPAITAERIAAVKTTDFSADPAAFSGDGPSGHELDKIRGGFLSSVWEKLARAKHYPKIARDRGYEGEPVVAFTIGKDGSLIELRLDKPSSFELLNEAALQTVRDASPYPSIPDPMNERTIKLKLPISFVLERP